jgi:HD-GYP domain-containing protein (c-di-GMP phosphodiesterase class II)
MLKKIAVSQLRIGMHLHKLEGGWMSHPFWKTRFVIDSTDDLQRLKACGVAECWIDVAKGLDVAQPDRGVAPRRDAPAPAVAPPAPTRRQLAAAPAAARDRAGPRPLHEELRQAASICHRGREAVVALFGEARLGRAVDVEGCLPLVDDIAASVERNPGALVSLARLKTRDDYSYMHSVAVCALMVALARQHGMDEGACREAGLAGLMHDIGKAAMPLEVLNKPGRLTDAEFAVIQGHPERGHAMLLEGGSAADATLDVVLHHHERMDGTGYPRRLAGEQISLLARMGAICDVYDAITSNRPYKAGWDPAESIAKMASWKGHFDERVFAAFVQSLGIYPTGSRVRLESGRLAIVVDQNPRELTAPVVKAFYSIRSEMRLSPQRIDLAARGCQDRIVGRDNGEHGDFGPLLDELWAGPEAIQRVARAA